MRYKYGISTKPKIHIILDHLEDYFNETEMSLLKTTGEIVEGFHQLVNKRLSKAYFVKDLSNPHNGERLVNLTCILLHEINDNV